MPTVFLTHTPDALKNYYGEKALAGLKALADVRLNPKGRELSTGEMIDAARGCEVIVTHRHVPGEPELFRSLPDLVAFCRCAMDIRNVDVAAASQEGILVTRASAGFIAATAELVVGMMLDLSRRISESVASFRAGQVPTPAMGRQLSGATLGVVGYGQIGRYLCRIGLALGMRVLVCDPYAKVPDASLAKVDLSTLLSESDYVVCLAAATDETENLFNAQAFARMKPDAFFINVSRGNLVDEAALARALDEGRIAGCAMDVGRAPDQMPTPALARHPKVIATPHIGGLTPQSIEHQSLETVGQVADILKGRTPKGAVNAERATRLVRMRSL